MKSIKDILADFIFKVVEDNEFYSLRAKVLDVDTDKNTCTVETTDNLSIIAKVQFSAFIGAEIGLFLIPAIDSIVTVNFYDKNDAYVAKTSVLSAFKLIFIDESENEISIFVDETGIVFNGGALGGLVKIAEMVTRFNELEALFTQLQTDFSGWVVSSGDGGAALKAVISAGFGAETVPNSQISDFENELVKQ